MHRYAQINADGYVESDSYLSGEVSADNMIPIDADFDLENKRYVDGEWVTYEPEVVPEGLLDERTQMQYEMAANIEYLTMMAEIGL